MPRRDDLLVLVLGSGPIVIGQACEFDYSGTQACKVLREEGLRVVLVNSNPATIMTDPAFADATYVEPLTVDVVAPVIEKERPDALLPTLGGQTAPEPRRRPVRAGVLEEHGVEVLGADLEAIQTAEDRQRVQGGDDRDRARVARARPTSTKRRSRRSPPPRSTATRSCCGPRSPSAARAAASPTTRAARRMIRQGLYDSPGPRGARRGVVLGWKEYELEVMRDRHDNCVVICSIENLDAMGVHTGDSITVAPAMTLSDPEYQQMRDAAFAVLRRIGVETGGSNVQFAVDPATGARSSSR
jgi:carbamoyl-phosphate synthase large subunit